MPRIVSTSKNCCLLRFTGCKQASRSAQTAAGRARVVLRPPDRSPRPTLRQALLGAKDSGVENSLTPKHIEGRDASKQYFSLVHKYF